METEREMRVESGQSGQIEKVAAALVAVQGEMTNPPKTKTVYAGQKKYSFAPLPEILDAVRPVLTKHGLALVQLVRERTLETRVVHTSGQWIGAAYGLPAVADSQAMGSAITYGRRYSLCALLGIAGEDDEDGEAASEGERAAEEAKRAEAAKRLDALKGKGQVRSAYDGKVLGPGEASLPAERAGKDETLDRRPETVDRGKDRATLTPALSPPRERGKTAHSAVLHEEGKVGTGKHANNAEGERGDLRSQISEGKTPSPPPSPLPPSPRLRRTGEGEGEFAGIEKRLAELMRKEGITAEVLKRYYVGKGHLPDSVEPAALPADYVAGLTKPENWKRALVSMKNG
jgi:hypothetical protein